MVIRNRSWISQMRGSIKGVIFGIILILVSIVLEWTNEGRAVKTSRSLEEGAKTVMAVPSDHINPANDQQLIHFSGWADATGSLTDSELGVTYDGISMNRKVEIYQWVETSNSKTEKKPGGGEETSTTYSYEKKWVSQPINSSEFNQPFGHENRGSLPYQNSKHASQIIKVGEFRLPKELVNRIGGSQPINTHDFDFTIAPNATNTGNGVYIGNSNQSSPEIGDVRVTYHGIPEQHVSIIGKQFQNTVEPYKADAGKEVFLLSAGLESAENMFDNALSRNIFITWLLRVLGIILMFIGFRVIFKPIATVGEIVPLVGRILSLGLGLTSFVLAIVFSFLVISLAWMAYRPWVGISFLIGAVALFFIIRSFGKKEDQLINS